MVRLFAAICLGVLFGTPLAARAPATNSQPSEAPPTTVHVGGFRDAKWGMTEAEVKSAIFTQFKMPIDKLKGEVNPTEKTTVLPITVPDLIEGAGTARIS